jgi:hypothetical protein
VKAAPKFLYILVSGLYQYSLTFLPKKNLLKKKPALGVAGVAGVARCAGMYVLAQTQVD